MNLPKGVYAVSEVFAGKSAVSFAFKGATYEAQVGENAFATLEDFVAAPLERVEDAFCGYSGTPVLVLSAGVYHNGNGPTKAERLRTYFPCAVTILGEHAGESPNGEDLRTAAWTDGSVIEGTFYGGSLGIKDPVSGVLTIDGVTLRNCRVADDRTGGENVGLALKNCAFDGYCAYSLVRAKPMKGGAGRFVHLQNIRADGIDDRAAEGRLLEIASGDLLVDGLYMARTEKFLGLTDYSRRERSNIKKLELKNVLVEECSCTHGLSIVLPEDSRAKLLLENCQFLNMTPPEDAVLTVTVPETVELTLRNTRFVGASAQSAVVVDGDASRVVLENTAQEGFSALCTRKPARRTEVMDNALLADPHIPVAAQMQRLDALYAGMKVYYGDFHCHSNSGGTSDGKTPIEEYAAGMDRMGVDFAAIVDHLQMRHFFLPCWDETRMICGTEPSTYLLGTNRPEKARAFDYTMIFPDKTGLRKVLEQFPFYEFGGAWDDSFARADLTWEQLKQVFRAVCEVGGLMAHAHPRQMMDSDDPLDYCFADDMWLETVHVDNQAYSTMQNRALWVKLLNLGKRMRTYGSSDSHAGVSNRGLTGVYSPRHFSTDIFEQVRSGNCTAGGVAVRMCIGDAPMGSEISYTPGRILSISVDGFHPAHYCADAVYSLRVYTDAGLAFVREFKGTQVHLGLPVQQRMYYRAEIWNESDGYPVALTNPIWLK